MRGVALGVLAPGTHVQVSGALPPLGAGRVGAALPRMFRHSRGPRAAPRPAIAQRLINKSLHAALRCTAGEVAVARRNPLSRLVLPTCLETDGCIGRRESGRHFSLRPLFAREAMARLGVRPRRAFSLGSSPWMRADCARYIGVA